MEKILTLGKIETDITKTLGFEFVQIPRFITDEDRHDFVLGTLKPREFDKLIIMIDSSDEYDGLKLGLHVRITLDLHTKRLVPLLFVSSDSILVILRNAGIWGRILTTKGCKLGQLNVDAIQSGLGFPALPSAEMNSFLKFMQLRPDEITGRHSLANQWGAYALDKAAGTNALRNNLSLVKARKQLYFKYVEAVNYDSENLNEHLVPAIDSGKSKTERIDAIGKKILLIDDEADKGWNDVLKVLFKTSDPTTDFQILARKINGWSAFTDEEKKLILDTGFDLFLIDLRLTGSEEEDTAKPENFSGTDVMRQIKRYNAGNQVIMFTASNKAWNLKALLDFGADGYYIKESPEYNFPESFSYENLNVFMKEAINALSKSYLRDIFFKIEKLKKALDSKRKSKSISKELMFELTRYLDFSFNCLKNVQIGIDSERAYSMSYTFLFLIIEALSKQLINHEEPLRNSDTYKFQFRKNEIFLKHFNTNTGMNTGRDFEIITKNHQYAPTIPYKQQICNLFSSAGSSSDKIISIVNKRNAFQHPNLIENKNFAIISQQDVSDVFEVVYSLTSRL